jgi:hypothetical protein
MPVIQCKNTLIIKHHVFFLNQKYLQIFNLQIGIDVRKKQYYSSFTNENSIINFTNGAINEI